MRALRIIFWSLFIVLQAVAITLFALALRFPSDPAGPPDAAWYEAALAAVPFGLTVKQFLLILAGFSLLAVPLLFLGAAAAIAFLATQVFVGHQQRLNQSVAARRRIGELTERHEREFRQLIDTGRTFVQQMDKGALLNALVKAAGAITKGAEEPSAVSLWVLDFESDTIHFEMGLGCEESMFLRTSFQPTEQPFVRVIQSKQPWMIPQWNGMLHTFLDRDVCLEREVGPGLLVVPLAIGGNVLGILVVFCQPEALARCEEAPSFFELAWTEMTMALAIAIQGEAAIFDRVTGLYNRAYFMKRLAQEMERARRYKFPLTLMMVDIDDFKLVNDMLGHQRGDAMLKMVARQIKSNLRSSDLAGRYGGDEFLLLLPETGLNEQDPASSGSMVVAERLRRTVDHEFGGLQKPLNRTVSVGVAVRRIPQDQDLDSQDLIRLADEQLYLAKTAGKNRVCLLEPKPLPKG